MSPANMTVNETRNDNAAIDEGHLWLKFGAAVNQDETSKIESTFKLDQN